MTDVSFQPGREKIPRKYLFSIFAKKIRKIKQLNKATRLFHYFNFLFFVENRKIRKMSKNTVWVIKSYFEVQIKLEKEKKKNQWVFPLFGTCYVILPVQK